MSTLYETSFEGIFQYYGGVSELEVPEGWVPIWVQGDEPGVNHRPEYKPETERRRTGKKAAKLFTTHASHDAVLCRTLAVAETGGLTLTAWGATFSLKAGQALRVGIDPTGDKNFPSERIVWGEWWGQYQEDWQGEVFHLFETVAEPQGTRATIYLHSRSDHAAQTVAAYWDDVTLSQAGDGDGEPEPGGEVDYARIRAIVREEIDKTRLMGS